MFSYPISLIDIQREEIERLYEQAAELNEQGRYEESEKVLAKCQTVFNSYDTELLAADNALQLECYDAAMQHLNLASYMVPCRFYPLYGKMLVFQKCDSTKADSIADILIRKPVKVPSADIDFIITEAKDQLAK